MLRDFKTEIKILFIVALIAVVISVAGVFLLRGLSPAPVEPIPPVTQQPSPPAPQLQALDTSGWQTYRNDEFGFEVKYPNEWEAEFPRQFGSSQFDFYLRPVLKHIDESITVTISYHQGDVAKYLLGVCCKGNNQTESINGKTFYTSGYLRYEGLQEWNYYHGDDKHLVLFHFGVGQRTGREEYPLLTAFSSESSDFRKILSTFRFVEKVDRAKNAEQILIDTSTWRTYRNDEFGFEVKYPSGWVLTERSKNFIDIETSGPRLFSIQILRDQISSQSSIPHTALFYKGGYTIFLSDAFYTADSPTRTFRQIEEEIFNQILATFRFLE